MINNPYAEGYCASCNNSVNDMCCYEDKLCKGVAQCDDFHDWETEKTVANVQDNLKKMIIYAVIMDWAVDEEPGHNEELFGAYEDALKSFRDSLEEEKTNGCIPDWEDEESFVVEEGEDHYECWLDGEYCGYHYKLTVEKKIVFVRPDYLEGAVIE